MKDGGKLFFTLSYCLLAVLILFRTDTTMAMKIADPDDKRLYYALCGHIADLSRDYIVETSF